MMLFELIQDRIDDPGSEPVEPTDVPPRNPDAPLWTPGEPSGPDTGIPVPAV